MAAIDTRASATQRSSRSPTPGSRSSQGTTAGTSIGDTAAADSAIRQSMGAPRETPNEGTQAGATSIDGISLVEGRHNSCQPAGGEARADAGGSTASSAGPAGESGGGKASGLGQGGEAAIKAPPLSRFLRWVLSFAVPGLGMFCEAYYIFSVGNVKPVWAEAYPECFKGNKGCSQTFLNALNYSQVSGLILGMVALGFTVDRIGRRWGSICTASVMFVGGILLTVAQGPSQHAVFLFLIVAQTVFGFGVGGEFPVAASSASERAEGSEKLKSRRGQTVVLVFAMQAWGNLLNVAVLLIFLAALGQSHPPYDNTALEITWRMSYGLGLIPISYMLYHRIFVLKESAVWQAERKAKAAQHGTNSKRDWRAMRYLVTHYWHRLLGTALGWFAWDFYYYGNKLFQSEFIGIIHPGTSLTGVLEYNFLNSSVALFGYYFAAFTIDKAWMGRRRMQVVGFGWLFALFLICGLAFNQLTASANNLKWFQALYYISSFWAQFGPNATTFLLAGELFPTETRGMAHGISAAVGKLGALSADIIMGKASDRSKFYLSAGAGALGVVVTLLFIPEIFSLDLQEGDRRWERINAGKSREYTGEAVNPKNLSWYEVVIGAGRQYQPPTAGRQALNPSSKQEEEPFKPDVLLEPANGHAR